MGIDSALGLVSVYVLVISALAIGVERLLDMFKLITKKHITREQPPERADVKSDEDLVKERKRHVELDEARQRKVRGYAIIAGIILAVLAQIDTFDLLGFPSPIWLGYPILGWVLSGLAASRGSAFWHDIIEVVKTIKETRREVLTAKNGNA